MSLKNFFLILTVFLISTLFSNDVFAQNFYQRELKLGSTGEDVLYLQQFLNKDTDTVVATEGVGSSQNETTYFGAKTRSAVIKFQEKYSSDILVPIGLSSGTGIVGPRTLAKLNSLGADLFVSNQVNTSGIGTNVNVDVSPVNFVPKVSSVNPYIIIDPENTEIVIKGSGFLKNNSVFLVTNRIEVFSSYSTNQAGTEIRAKLNTAWQRELENLLTSQTPENKEIIIDNFKKTYETLNDYGIFVNGNVFVQNGNGESNAFPIKINIYKNDPTPQVQ